MEDHKSKPSPGIFSVLLLLWEAFMGLCCRYKIRIIFSLTMGFVGIEACHEDWQGDPFWDLHMSNYYGP